MTFLLLIKIEGDEFTPPLEYIRQSGGQFLPPFYNLKKMCRKMNNP